MAKRHSDVSFPLNDYNMDLQDPNAKKVMFGSESDRREQKQYEMTSNNKPVDIEKLKELASIGFERPLSAEALRMNENDMKKALDVLADAEKNCALQSNMESERMSRNIKTTDATQLAAAINRCCPSSNCNA